MALGEDLIASMLLLLSSPEVWQIAGLSLFISINAVILASIIGIPIGVYLGKKNKQRIIVVTLINTGMGLPPVFVGLIVYLLLSRQGALGVLQLLFTPLAMIIAQFILTLPIVIGVTRSTIRAIPKNLPEALESLGATPSQIDWQILKEARSGIMVGIILALGRAFSEVGAIIIVGGNIRYHTRVLTTAIITEISKGNNPGALALGIILIFISFSLTSIMSVVQLRSNDH
jgi:tungstate transport system permease protein